MNMNFISVNIRLPELYNAVGIQVSDILPVILKTKAHCYASLWDTTWRNAFTGEVLKDVTHWGELNVENSE